MNQYQLYKAGTAWIAWISKQNSRLKKYRQLYCTMMPQTKPRLSGGSRFVNPCAMVFGIMERKYLQNKIKSSTNKRSTMKTLSLTASLIEKVSLKNLKEKIKIKMIFKWIQLAGVYKIRLRTNKTRYLFKLIRLLRINKFQTPAIKFQS